MHRLLRWDGVDLLPIIILLLQLFIPLLLLSCTPAYASTALLIIIDHYLIPIIMVGHLVRKTTLGRRKLLLAQDILLPALPRLYKILNRQKIQLEICTVTLRGERFTFNNHYSTSRAAANPLLYHLTLCAEDDAR